MSDASRFYGIDGVIEARAYLDNEILGARLREITGELLKFNENNPFDIFGTIDTIKLKSCMTLFNYVSDEDIFMDVLEKLSTTMYWKCMVVDKNITIMMRW